MTKRMLVDATHPEETRVAIVDSYRDQNRLDDLDFDLASKPILRGNIYLAKVMRIEPSLQAAFVEYGGNRHGFLPFSEIHPDYFRIPMSDRPADEEPEESAASTAPVEVTPEPQAVTQDQTAVPVAEQPAPEPEAAAPALAEAMAPLPPVIPTDGFQHHDDTDVGLITDFGNAAVISSEAAPEPMIVESVGGDVPERVSEPRQRRPRYKIQEVLKRGQIMLIQVVKEERGNKGAALTTFLSLAGRYCVLMPNTDHGGGVSRKITNHQDRRRLKEILDQLEVPEGMAVILRTAGMEQEPPEIQRDLEYLLRLWDSIREQTLQSTAPTLIYEEANLIKRSVRDLHGQDIAEILVAGEDGYRRAREFMQTIMPDQVEKIRLYKESVPLFFRYQVESQIDTLHSPIVQLRSGGYLVINPTEALVSIDVNSGRATRERHIEETALKTNLEAADEIARQLRLRDLAGLVVIDFIDMEDGRNNAAVERRLKEAMKNDRARLQIGRISPFGLLELSRQRLRPSLLEINFEKCPHCAGTGHVRSTDSAALSILRAIEEEGIRQRGTELVLHVATKIALYILNQKRAMLSAIEQRYDLHVLLHSDDSLVPPDYRLERSRQRTGRPSGPAVNTEQVFADAGRDLPPMRQETEETADEPSAEGARDENGQGRRRSRRDRNRGENRGDRRDRWSQNRPPLAAVPNEGTDVEGDGAEGEETPVNGNAEGAAPGDENNQQQRRRRRGRRGGRRRNGNAEQRPEGERTEQQPAVAASTPAPVVPATPIYIPTSIHELDTTPRPVGEEPRAPSPYEVVNPASDKPKAGWWRRLTGQ